ncbi:MAG: sugar ABC transporter permease, partial [Pseudomonadota bacterium]
MVAQTEAGASATERPVPPKVGLGPMARRELRLAFGMLAPTFAIVLGVVLFPLLANFWISFKPVQLADLRPPTPIANERLRGDAEAVGAEVQIQYRLRNSSPKASIINVVMDDVVPAGLEPGALDERCSFDAGRLTCTLGDFEPGYRESLELPFTVAQAYLDDPVNPRDSEPTLEGNSQNILTSFEFTLENFSRVFNASEFWHVLRVTIYYTVFGTAGALV